MYPVFASYWTIQYHIAPILMLQNLVSIFADRGVSRGQRGGSPMVVNLSFLDWKVFVVNMPKRVAILLLLFFKNYFVF
jgi:hypothetical protein